VTLPIFVEPALDERVVEPVGAVAADTALTESVADSTSSGTMAESWVAVENSMPQAVGGALAVSALTMYEEFDGTVALVGEASRRELLEGIERVVGAEGPVLGERLHTAYVRASGGQRVGKAIAAELNKVITQAVRQGRLIADNPLGEVGVKPRTYRLPSQPTVRMRNLGPRSFEEIPPRELVALLDHVAERVGDGDEEALYRAVLELLGLKRFTPNVKKRFITVHALCS
jgi:hypothetical protein